MSTDATNRLDRQRAYMAGWDSVVRGPNTTNCHFSLFATPELTEAWERGKRDAEAAGDNVTSEYEERA